MEKWICIYELVILGLPTCWDVIWISCVCFSAISFVGGWPWILSAPVALFTGLVFVGCREWYYRHYKAQLIEILTSKSVGSRHEREPMNTFVFESSDSGANSNCDMTDLQKVKGYMYQLLETYKVQAKSKHEHKRDKTSLRKCIDNMTEDNKFISLVQAREVNYEITPDNFDQIIQDMTYKMVDYCDEPSFRSFKQKITRAILSGLKLCDTHVYDHDVSVVSFNEHFLFVMSYTLKIKRTKVGWFVTMPVVKGQFASFLLQVSTVELFKFFEKNVIKTSANDDGNKVVVVPPNPQYI